ncbi:MAG: metalloendopeptidase, partial [Phycisphaerae bacterium]
RVEALKSTSDIQAYQRSQREKMLAQLGDFPERTPLEPNIVGTIRREGFRIEKVIFQSQPQHHVTANLYLPDGTGPFPGVIVSSGHSRTGKTADYNQRFGIAMAQNGIAALCYDPIGQGERSQVLNDKGNPAVEATTEEHFLVGSGSILVGRNTATYRIWDA